MVKRALDLIQFNVLWEPEPPNKAAMTPLNAVPLVVFVLLLLRMLPAVLQNIAVFHKHLQALSSPLPLHMICIVDNIDLTKLQPGDSRAHKPITHPMVVASFSFI